jgi:hypothetical protein
MLRALDPHSNFYDQAEWSELFDEQRSGYTGIGATIANYESSGTIDTYILSTFPSSPAARARLRFGDRIVSVNGEKMSGLSSEVVRDKIRGLTGSVLRIAVERSDPDRIETIELRRGRVPQPSIPDSYIISSGIGYIDLSEGFSFTTSDEFNSAFNELTHHLDRLAVDHAHARQLAEALGAVDAQVCDPAETETNIVMTHWQSPEQAAAFTAGAAEAGIRVSALGPTAVRLVTHLDVDDAAIDQACSLLPGIAKTALQA